MERKCKSCAASVYWLRHLEKGGIAPIDVEPTEKGNISINLEDGTYQSVPKAEREGKTLYTNHFATCPTAALHARKKG
jgi:hypothetical protein